MEDFDREEREEMHKQAIRYEQSKLSGEKVWFDSDNFIDIIDWYNINNNNVAAEEVTLRAYKLFPDNEEIISRYTLVLANKNQYEKAIQITKQALEKFDSDDLRIDLASLYIDSQTCLDKALNLLLDVVKRDNENYFLWLLIGRVYLEKEDCVNAEENLRIALKYNQTDKMLLGCYSDCAFDEKLEDITIRTFYDLTHKYPFNDLLWVTLGVIYSRYEYTQEAIESLDYAIAINPGGEIRHACKADCLIAQKDYTNAKTKCNSAESVVEYFNAVSNSVLAFV